ncbi:MAG: helix-turn-helix domain-containing protein [Oscillospiraceae bacterium]|nr:helix-turn-helix domain-containing protein [Oscillospiraceae bacterium]
MSVIVNLEELMVKKGIAMVDLAHETGIAPGGLSMLKTGKAKAIRLETIEKLCKALSCTAGELITYKED